MSGWRSRCCGWVALELGAAFLFICMKFYSSINAVLFSVECLFYYIYFVCLETSTLNNSITIAFTSERTISPKNIVPRRKVVRTGYDFRAQYAPPISLESPSRWSTY